MRFLSRRVLVYCAKVWKAPILRMATAVPSDKVEQPAGEGEEGVEKEEESVKRGRGRPKKTASGGGGQTRKRRRDQTEEAAEAGEGEPPPAKKGRGRPKKSKAEGEGEEKAPPKKKGRAKKEATDSADGATAKPGASKVTDWASVKWNEMGQTSDSRPWNIKFSTWNVNGIRAWLKNGGLEYITHESPDVFCLQEIKCLEADLPKDKLEIPGYHIYWNPAIEPGYSGTGLYSKVKPVNVTFGMGIEKHDKEGRLITCEYDSFYFVTAYVPNAGEGLKRLAYRQEWDVDFRAYLKALDAKKPLVLCGDLNVAHEEIDLKNPKTNKSTAGFTQEERDGFTALLGEGFVDTFRQLYPERQAFTYWSYRFNARARNIGWRLDYYVLSQRLLKDVCDCVIRSEVLGSDHCPLVLSLALT